MLSEKLVSDICGFIESRVASAEMIIDGNKRDMEILKTEASGNILKIFTNASDGKGRVSDIFIKDREGNVIISKPDSFLKSTGYSLVVSFYIRVKEVEIDDPIGIFDLDKGVRNE